MEFFLFREACASGGGCSLSEEVAASRPLAHGRLSLTEPLISYNTVVKRQAEALAHGRLFLTEPLNFYIYLSVCLPVYLYLSVSFCFPFLSFYLYISVYTHILTHTRTHLDLICGLLHMRIMNMIRMMRIMHIIP